MIGEGRQAMENRPVLLVEDNPDDVDLTLRALKKHKISLSD